MVKNIMEALINVSEKAANIARACRRNEHLFSLLIQEKSSDESNSRFVKDFKTLADVLIQETIRLEVATLVSENNTLHTHIHITVPSTSASIIGLYYMTVKLICTQHDYITVERLNGKSE